ncbi:MAG: DNA alkylation repair protein [Anaerolineae bacterium]|nr:DNA alkylation repair protein [Anaerolineae bacterium]
MSNERVVAFFTVIQCEATDDRNFAKKAVNWALRNIGKRSQGLNQADIEVAEEIGKIDSKAARRIASNVLRADR